MKLTVVAVLTILVGLGMWMSLTSITNRNNLIESVTVTDVSVEKEPTEVHPMDINKLRQGSYQGSDITILETLASGSNYSRFIASYESEGNTINGLLTIPSTPSPESGFPMIVLLHGYIPPDEYRTTERYVAYQDGFARNGYVTYKIDLRGHGDSEGEPVNSHFSEAYVVDTLHAVSSLQNHPQTNPEKVGLWGHSNGGELGLRTMVISDQVDAGVFWAGVVGSFEVMLETYNSDIHFLDLTERRFELVEEQGLPSSNPDFWQTIDPHYFLEDISGPIQLHHGTADDSVPLSLSRELAQNLEQINKNVELFEYSGGDHNIGNPHFGTAMQRSITFFDEYLK